MSDTTRHYYKTWKATDVRAYIETNEDPAPGDDWQFAVHFELPDGTRATINELGDWYAPANDWDSITIDYDYEDANDIRDTANFWLHREFSKAYSLGKWDEATYSFEVTGPDKRIISNE